MQNFIGFAVHSGCLRRCLRSPVPGKRPTPSRRTASTGISQRVPPFLALEHVLHQLVKGDQSFLRTGSLLSMIP